MQDSPILFHWLTDISSSPASLGYMLVSWWKPLLLMLPILAWLWFITTVADKHALRFHLARKKWNLAHLIIATLSILGVLLIPLPGILAIFIAFVSLTAVLFVEILVYINIANRDDRVPEAFQIKLDMSSFKEARKTKAASKHQGKVALTIHSAEGKVIAPPHSETPEYQVRLAAEGIYLKACEARAAQLDVLPTGKDGRHVITFLVDGVRQQSETLSAQDAAKFIDFWKSAAKLDLSDRRRKLSGEMSVGDTTRRDIRVTTSGTAQGMRMTLLFDPKTAVDFKADDLGLLENQMDTLKQIVDDGKGVVLLASPPDNGLTSSLYAIVRMHDAYTSNVQTIEFDTQVSLEGIRQNIFDPMHEGADHATLVRSTLRRDPDVVGIAELPDADTAKQIAQSDTDRTRTYLCIKSDNAHSAIQIWNKAVGEDDAAAEPLHGVIAQKLMRKLCTNCRVPYQPSADMLKKLGLPADKVKQLYKKGGQVIIKNKPDVCPICNGGGYFGQTAAYEVYPIGPDDREMLKQGNLAGLRAELKKKQLPSIQQVAIRKAVQGITSVEEVMRIMASPKKSSTKPAPKPAAKAGT